MTRQQSIELHEEMFKVCTADIQKSKKAVQEKFELMFNRPMEQSDWLELTLGGYDDIQKSKKAELSCL